MTLPPVFDALTSPPQLRRLPAVATPLLAFLVFVAAGLVGLYRYVDSYWLYRGFPPPHDPAYVTQAGSFQTISVRSPAVGAGSSASSSTSRPGTPAGLATLFTNALPIAAGTTFFGELGATLLARTGRAEAEQPRGLSPAPRPIPFD